MQNIFKTQLGPGLSVVTESQALRSGVAVQFWLVTGARFAADDQVGFHHLVEHLVFRTQDPKTGQSYLQWIESVGGSLSANTGHEFIKFYLHIPRAELQLGVKCVANILTQLRYDLDDWATEVETVSEEVRLGHASAEEHLWARYLEKQFVGKGLGVSLTGTEDNLDDLDLPQVFDFFNQEFLTAPLVVTAVGDLDHKEFVQIVEAHFNKETRKSLETTYFRETQTISFAEIKPLHHFEMVNSDVVHILYVLPAAPITSEERILNLLVSSHMGGGMTSCLYQNLSTKSGLAYSVDATLYTFSDVGFLSLHVVTSIEKVGETMMVLDTEWKRLVEQGLAESELDFIKRKTCGELELSLDSLEARSASLAMNEVVFGKIYPPQEVIALIKQISLPLINAFIAKTFAHEASWIFLGPRAAVQDVETQLKTIMGMKK